MDQRDDQAVDEHQPMPGASPRLTFRGPAASLVTTTLDHGLPRARQLINQASQMLPGDTGEQLMREDVPVDHDHHAVDHPTLARPPFNRNHAPARKSGPSPAGRARPGSKHHIITAGQGITLAVSLNGEIRNDDRQLACVGQDSGRRGSGRPAAQADGHAFR
ncbi:hypothetical protein [Streptomyces flaveolus]|uniref:hypothetical protein n=1 Tax=Streptomyces flaveolus TaxID=67297 RepID=UPI0037B4EF06